MFDKKYEMYLFAFLMAFFMAGFMSFIVTLINVGLVDNLVLIWLNAYWKVFLIAFPTVLVVVPQVKKLIKLLIRE